MMFESLGNGGAVDQEADQLLSLAFGLTDVKPRLVELDIDAGRMTQFVDKFLARHRLTVCPARVGPPTAAIPSVAYDRTDPRHVLAELARMKR